MAELLKEYRYSDVALVALSDGGVIIAAQIAAQLHCPLMLLLTKDVILLGEQSIFGVVDQNGGFTFNDYFSMGELEEFSAEFKNSIEQQKMEGWHELNRLLGDGGILDESIIAGRTVILVSDGVINGLSIQAAQNFLKKISVKRLVIATPLATVNAVDTMHLVADELHVMHVASELLPIDHYYQTEDRPSHEAIVKTLNHAILNWK